MTTKTKVASWMRTLVVAVVCAYSLLAFVFAVLSGVFLGIRLPGSPWIYLGVVSLVLALVVIGGVLYDRAGLYWLLKALNLEQLLESKERRLEYRKVVQSINDTLQRFKQQSFNDNELQVIECLWPADAKEDVAKCCRDFAGEQKIGLDALVLELLYWGSGSDAENTRGPWTKVLEPQKKKLARILVKRKQPDGFDNPDQTVAALEFILNRIDYFDIKLIQSEISALAALWRLVRDYAGYLGRSGLSRVIPNLSSPAEFERLRGDVAARLNGDVLSQTSDEKLADLLKARGKEWIQAWDKTLSEEAADSLAIASLGIFNAETLGIRSQLLPCLTSRAARDEQAVEILFVYLWKKSREDFAIRDSISLSELKDWPNLVQDAEAEMGKGLTNQVCGKLYSELTNGQWLTWIPIHEATEEIVAFYERLESLERAAVRDHSWNQKMKKLQKELGLKISLESKQLFKTLKAELDQKYAIPDRPIPTTVQEVKEGLDDVAASFRPETKLVGYLSRYQAVLDTLGLFRERSDDLARQLQELSKEMEAEAGGGEAYLITFDQTRGALADLIDSIQDKYTFLPYTRYSRIGKLRPGQGFESFCRELEGDLEKLITAARDPKFPKRFLDVGRTIGADNDKLLSVVSAITAARLNTIPKAPDWEQVEITVQQISWFHRHDLIRDTKFPPMIRRDFRDPPTPELSVKELNMC